MHQSVSLILVSFQYLIVKAVDRTAPLREDIEREFGIDKTPVFKTRKGAILEEMSAVQLLNRYCNTLPNDSFTLATVTWTQHVTKDEKGGPYMVTVKVRLPMQSTVKEEIVVGGSRTLNMVHIYKSEHSLGFRVSNGFR